MAQMLYLARTGHVGIVTIDKQRRSNSRMGTFFAGDGDKLLLSVIKRYTKGDTKQQNHLRHKSPGLKVMTGQHICDPGPSLES